MPVTVRKNLRKTGYMLWILACLCGCIHTPPRTPNPTETALYHPLLQARHASDQVGVNIHFYDITPTEAGLLQQAGIRWLRMDVSWAHIERAPGQYDFSSLDRLVNGAVHHNVKLVLILDYGNPLYDDGRAPYSETGRAAWARFAAALGERYRGKPVIWELWNEPNLKQFWAPQPDPNKYMAWCRSVVEALRRSDPNACIVGPATSRVDLPFLESCFAQGFLDLVNGVTVHPYRKSTLGPETALPEYEKLHALIAKYGGSRAACLPILSGEWGYTTTEISPERQAEYLARQWLTHAAYGVPLSIWYDWRDDGPDPKEREHNFGTLHLDSSPKPAYLAMRAFCHTLNGFTCLGWLESSSPNDHLVLFHNADEEAYILAAWTITDPHAIPLPPHWYIKKATNHIGEQVTVENTQQINLSTAPQYFYMKCTKPSSIRASRNHPSLRSQ